MQDKYIVMDIETHGLNPWFGDFVTCICAKDSEGGEFRQTLRASIDPLNDDMELLIKEYKLITSFERWMMEKIDFEKIITHNGIAFDLPFLFTRMVLTIPDSDRKPMSHKQFLLYHKHFDTMKIAKKWISLQDIAALYGLEGKNGNGENAIKLWDFGKFDELEEYCMNDVNVTEQIYLTWKKLNEKKEVKNVFA